MANFIFKFGFKAWLGFEFIRDRFWLFFIKGCMGHCGHNVKFFPTTSVIKGVENMYLADDVRFGRYAMIYTSDAKFIVDTKVAIAPYFKVITGNHRSHVGHFFFDNDMPVCKEDNKDVHIESDCWVGTNVTMLSGATLRRGSIAASAAVLNKSFPAYAIVGGIPAKLLAFRFTIPQVMEHEKALYPENERFTEEELRAMRKDYQHLKNA